MEAANIERLKTLLVLIIVFLGFGFMGCSSGSSESESAATAAPNVVTDIVWEWKRPILWDRGGETQSRSTIIFLNPEKYTLILRDDGTFSGTADCNEIHGTYEEGYASLIVESSTAAFCGEGSLDQQYIDLLNRVVTGGLNGDIFALELSAGDGHLEFRNGGTAPPQ